MSGKLLFKNIETETLAYSLAPDSKNPSQNAAFSRFMNSTLATPIEETKRFVLSPGSHDCRKQGKGSIDGNTPHSPTFETVQDFGTMSDRDMMDRVRSGAVSNFSAIFGEILKRVKVSVEGVELDQRRLFGLVEMADMIGKKFGTDVKRLRQVIPVKDYESLFRLVFRTKVPSLIFVLANLELSYAQKVSKNFRLLVKFLVEDPTRLDAWTYVRLFLRLSYFVMAQHKTLCSSLKKRDPVMSKSDRGRGWVLKQLENLPEFAGIIKLNRFELFRQKKAHFLDERVSSAILQSLKLTGTFPLAQFDLLNRNLARIYFWYYSDGANELPSGLFWQGAVHALNMFPDIPMEVAAPATFRGLKELTRMKAIDHLLREYSNNGTTHFKSKIQVKPRSVLESFRFKTNLNNILVSTETLSRVERFSCYEASELSQQIDRLRNTCNLHVDPTVYLFKAFFGSALKGFYYYKRLSAQNPNFAQIGLLRAAAGAFREFLISAVRLGRALGRYSRAMAVNTNDILGLVGRGGELTQNQRKSLISTVVKVKKSYESVFGYLESHRKLYHFVKATQEGQGGELFEEMSRFVF